MYNPIKTGKRSRRGLGRLVLQERDTSTGALEDDSNLGHQMALEVMLGGKGGMTINLL